MSNANTSSWPPTPGVFNFQSNQGWECPRCNAINAPHVAQCPCSAGREFSLPSFPLGGGTERVHERTEATTGGYRCLDRGKALQAGL